MAIILSMKEDAEFKQMILLIQNLIWLVIEYLFLDWDSPIKFRVIRVLYFGFLGTSRIDIFDNPETDDNFYPKLWKTIKVYFTDFFCMVMLIWIFGRSIYVYPVSVLEAAFILTMLFLPERIFSPNKSFLWQITLRSEDWRKHWKRKPNLQICSVLFGAWIGSQVSCLKLDATVSKVVDFFANIHLFVIAVPAWSRRRCSHSKHNS